MKKDINKHLKDLVIKSEKGLLKGTKKVIVEIDPKYYRPSEVENLLGDPSKAKKLLGWNPSKTSFEKLVQIMMASDMKLVERETTIKKSYD